MNPYTTPTRARIQPHDVANAVFSDAFIATTKLPGLERQRGWQAEAEVDRLLKQHGIPPASVSSRIAMVRQTIGATSCARRTPLMDLRQGGCRWQPRR